MKQRIYHMTNIYLMNKKCLLNKKRTSETVTSGHFTAIVTEVRWKVCLTD